MKVAVTPLERKVLRRVLSCLGPADCVVLIGSVARGTRDGAAGDLDILAIDGTGAKPLAAGIQTTVFSLEILRERVLAGDDFTQWALRFGLPLRGRRRWEAIRRELLPMAPWPKPSIKLKHAARRLTWAKDVLATGDAEAAQEELLYAVGHLARAELLEKGVFPLSRPELADQLSAVGKTHLADLLRRLDIKNQLREKEVADLLAHIQESMPGMND